MTTAITIITCERPGGVSYVRDTAERLLREGAAECAPRLLLGDGCEPPLVTDWERRFRPEPSGVRRMMWWAFELACSSGCEAMLFCEDDLVPCRNAVRRALLTPVPYGCAFVDFHDMKELRGGEKKCGFFSIPSMGLDRRGYWGNQCMLLPRRTLEWLLLHDPLDVSRWHPPHHADNVLGFLLAQSPWPRYAVHLPRLVRHVGAVSSAHPGSALAAERLTADFPGEDFDALTLAAPPLVELNPPQPASAVRLPKHRSPL